MSTHFNWRVQYGRESATPKSKATAAFNSLRFEQRFDNGIGWAEHKFRFINAEDLGDAIEDLEGDTISFRITNTDDSQQYEWKHQVVQAFVDYDATEGFPVRVLTKDLKNKLNLDERNIAHRFEDSFTEKVKSIVKESGLKTDKWESAEPIEEFKVLRQMNMTDYMFITQQLIPRIPEAYVLYCSEGDKVNFHSLGYQAATYAPEGFNPEVEERSNLQAAIAMGGGHLKCYGYDPKRKAVIFNDPPAGEEDLSPSWGEDDPSYNGTRSLITPFHTQEGLDAFNTTRHKHYAYHRYGVSAAFEGHIPEDGWKEPKILDLSSTNYKDGKLQTGLMYAIEHTVRNSHYKVKIHSMKNKRN